MGDVWSPNDPLVFCVSVAGEARGWFYGVVAVSYTHLTSKDRRVRKRKFMVGR